ncbi:unnamed protein product [Notodromas monacha]|uniref:MARVEL domain-containing protein n=1 Tax=Notodromas monacha TaxID=399045 RepID=A0A7R9BHL2_9CRUS|nr:unnamed protein product [Notodromas monacha]CAG0915613.1 unnamed protein product [Notodromas monacha]
MDPGFPAAHTTVTTATTKTNQASASLWFDASYVRTTAGILKIAAMVLSAIGFICIAASDHSQHSKANWYYFVCIGGFWITGVLLVFYLFHIVEKFYTIKWLLIEFLYNALWSFFYMTAAAACASQGGRVAAWAAAAFFGFIAMMVYGFDAFLKFKGYRSGELPQETKLPTTTTGQPSY